MIRNLLTVILFLMYSVLPLYSADMDTIYLWKGPVPGESEPKLPLIEDNSRGEVTSIMTHVTDPALVEFSPDPSDFNGTSVIVCPGGAYNIVSIDKEGYEIADWLNSLGYRAYVLLYRVPQKQAGALMDLQRALRIVRSREQGSGKIGVLGFSAGGSLSARASTRFNDRTYDPLDQIDELSCRPDFAVLIYPAYLDQGPDRSLTPELTVTKDTPPTFIFGTADDHNYGNSSLVMAGALRDAGVPVELHMLPFGGHGYGLRKGNRAAETWPVLYEKWFESIR